MGVDIGGTFTDFSLFHEDMGRVAIHKQLTTPHDPSACVIDGFKSLLRRENVPVEEVSTVVHGTTLVSNAVIERKGAVTGMLVTAGFADVLDIALEHRYDLFDLRLKFPRPLVPRRLRYEIDERIQYDGEVRRPLDLDEARRAITALIDEHKIEALAVCLMHSYANPAHEQAIADLIADEFPELNASTSSDVFPFMKEYERWTTATVNAYTQPMVDRYLENLEGGLGAEGFAGRLFIMASNGGTITPETARRFPVRMLESGPAAGVLMSAFHGNMLNLPDLLSFDMGGTTAKGSLVQEDTPLRKYEMELARVHEFKPGSGLPVRIPVIDMIEIGAGGGSIAEVDDRGVIRVGPRSAGADPGPACYGLGGDAPTLTDANVVLGYLDPAFFLGGQMKLDASASAAVITRDIAKPLELDLTRAAWGIHEIINEDVARAFRVHASERGFDYRHCSMIAFGGSGPIHAFRIARKLRIPRVIFPVGAGVMSAFGLLVSPLSFEIVRTDRTFLDDLGAESFVAKFQPLIDETSDYLRQAGVVEVDIRITRRLDMRYYGQGYEVEVTLPDQSDAAALVGQLPKLFAAAYEKVFSMSFLEEALEVVNWKVEAVGPLPGMGEGYQLVRATAETVLRKGTRAAYFPERGGFVDCPVYNRYALQPGAMIEGPALVEENESTCAIGVGDTVRVDERYNLVGELTETESTR
jgi:N-methylhydantoinase A